MIATLMAWLGGKLAAPLAAALAVLFAAAFLWQSARIGGLPLLGGGLKSEVAALRGELAARDLAEAKAEAALLAARQRLAAKGEAAAAAQAAAQARTETQIQTVIEKVPVYVSEKTSAACVIPWGFVRLFDAAASGAGLADVRDRIAPGQPDDAASDVTLSALATLLAADFGIARQNAGQLERLETAVGPAGADE
jgi:hypothetical protein